MKLFWNKLDNRQKTVVVLLSIQVIAVTAWVIALVREIVQALPVA